MNYDGLEQEFLQLLLARDRTGAVNLVERLARDGADIRDIYLRIFEPVLYEIGSQWENNLISVAQEHYATAIIQLAMSRLYPRLFAGSQPRNGKTLVACCVSGELHEVGIRMVADFFELEGWDTHYLGASMPDESLLGFLSETKPDLLCVSASMRLNIDSMKNIIQAVRKTPALDGTRILIGGAPFRQEPELVEGIGADGWAGNAFEAVRVGESLGEGQAHHA